MFDKNYVFSLMTRAKGCPFETQLTNVSQKKAEKNPA